MGFSTKNHHAIPFVSFIYIDYTIFFRNVKLFFTKSYTIFRRGYKMNYYPYFNGIPYMTAAPVARTGLFGNLFRGINFSSILSGTQKTLGIVNQAIPLVKQAKPVLNNAKTMFRVMNEFKKVDTPTAVEEVSTSVSNSPTATQNVNEVSSEIVNNNVNNGITFFQ